MGLPEVPEHRAPADPGPRPDPVDEQAEILALVAPLRRFALSRLEDVHDADDVVQETLTRVLAARGRLGDETLTGYAFAVARNLIATQHREAEVHRRHAPRLVDPREPEQPDHVVLAAEERRALATALRDLPERQRDQLVEHVVHDTAVTDLAKESGTGKIAAQLARTRARLRLDYLLALRGVTLPTPRCRPVLLAVSAGDRHRQTALRASDHIANCRTCFELSEPLQRRRRALAGVMPWIPLGARHGQLVRWVRAHPAQSVTAGTLSAGAAVVVAATVLSGTPAAQQANPVPSPPPPATATSPSASSTPAADTTLIGPDGPVLPVAGDLADLAGRSVRARGVRVLAVPADEGFWVGDRPGHRVWVELRTGGESPETIRSGQRLTFTGVVVRNDPGFVRRLGLSDADGAHELTRQGAHIEADAEDVRTS
jgi:RNA polymerase sigma factor (sigma-70 family)